MSPLPVTFDDVTAAADRLDHGIARTPCKHSQTVSELTGAEVFIKFENLQFTASFKDRGARNRVLTLTPDQRRRGVVAASAGNHAQGLAHACRELGVPVTIVMPESTPFTKVHNTTALGAEVELSGQRLGDSMARADELAARGSTLVPPFDDHDVIAGQGTVGLEMLQDFHDLEVIVVPVGGGGLLGGMAVATKHLSPGIEIIGVQTEAFPGMIQALAGEPTVPTAESTVAEGIAVKAPSELTLELARRLVDDMVTVGEGTIENAVGIYLEIEKMVAEGAGAASLAALLEHPDRFTGRRVGIVLSGGNIDLRVLSEVTMRHLVRSGRLVRLRVTVDDTPGNLAGVTAIVAVERANVVEIGHHRLSGVLGRRSDIDLLLETMGPDHIDHVRVALEQAGHDVELIEA
ncbi:MAG: threonine ammonia-lyase [Acidimicrobiia bacterium]|nr:threonine ammonia-lyase [Acidimicrobiia bacterium]